MKDLIFPAIVSKSAKGDEIVISIFF